MGEHESGPPRWWAAAALGHRYVALWSNGRPETWITDKVSKGPVFGVNVGRVDEPAPSEANGVVLPNRPTRSPVPPAGTGGVRSAAPISFQVYRCPVHGLIESPTWHEDSGWYCPVNLTGKAQASHEGITDEVCGRDVTGPYSVAFRKSTTARCQAFARTLRARYRLARMAGAPPVTAALRA